MKLSTANTHSYDKIQVPFRVYVDNMMEEQTLDKLGSETFYHFGDNNFESFHSLFSNYKRPNFNISKGGTLAWGLGGSGSGVPFHTHGAVFAEVIHGKKRWFLYPPNVRPKFDPNESTLRWLRDVYSKLSDLEMESGLLECTVNAGEVIFLPFGWWHATLNIGQSVFMSVFV